MPVGDVENNRPIPCEVHLCVFTLWSQMIGVVKNIGSTKRNMCCMMRIPQRMW